MEATEDLNAVNGGEETLPWRTTFCFGRALQGSTRKVSVFYVHRVADRDIVHVILIVIQDAKISIRGNILMIDDDWKNIYCD